MNDLDRRILTKACGLCWHEWVMEDDFIHAHCKLCGKKGDYVDTEWPTLSFSTADYWELVRVNVIVEYLKHYICYLEVNGGNSLWYRLTQTSEENCQSAADFIKFRPDLFPWAVEMEEKK